MKDITKNLFWCLGVLLILVMIPLVAAEVYQTGSTVDIKQPCFNGGNFCSSSAQCNLSVFTPKNVDLVSGLGMTNQIAFHNYTLNSTQLNESGIYTYCVTCVDGDINGSSCFEFTINPPGIDPSESRTDALTRSIYIFFALAVLLFIGSFFVDLTPLRWSMVIIGGIFVIISINVLSVSLQDEVVNSNLERLLDVVTASSILLYWFAAGLIFIIWTITVLMSIVSKQNARKIARFE